MNTKFIELTGKRFGKLLVLRRGENKGVHARWVCKCDCGKESLTWGSALRGGLSRSCGCNQGSGNLSHGHTRRAQKSKSYSAWADMLDRCNNPKNRAYPRYGGRGIKVCEKWRTLNAFLADMGEAPQGKFLDRINNDGNYEPANCRWVTPRESAQNRCTTKKIEFLGQVCSIAEWARRSGLTVKCLYWRLNNGWSPRKALTEIPKSPHFQA